MTFKSIQDIYNVHYIATDPSIIKIAECTFKVLKRTLRRPGTTQTQIIADVRQTDTQTHRQTDRQAGIRQRC